MKERFQSADRILIPKGEDRVPCIDALQEFMDIEVPEFRGEKLMAMSGGKKFWLVKGSDVPGLIDGGFADVGATGRDSLGNYDKLDRRTLCAQQIGGIMCRFSILTNQDMDRGLIDNLCNDLNNVALPTVTSMPLLLSKIALARDLPFIPLNVKVSGSVEGVMDLVGAKFAADLVVSGETARQNGLTEAMKLWDVYPISVARRQA